MNNNTIHIIFGNVRQWGFDIPGSFIRASNIDNLASSVDLPASLEQ